MSEESLAAFATVFGRAKGRLSPSSPHYAIAVLFDFLFTLQVAHDGTCLQIKATDFHSHSWTADFSIRQLSDLRDDIGLGGSWEGFLQFLQQAFASEHVVMQLDGPASAVGGEGATSAKLIGRKNATGLRVDLGLTSVPSNQRDDTKGSIAIALHSVYQNEHSRLQQAESQASQLEQALAQERTRAEQLQTRLLGGRHSDRMRRSQATTLDPNSFRSQTTLPATAKSQDPFSQTQSFSQTQASQQQSPPPVESSSQPPTTATPVKRAAAKAGARHVPKRVPRRKAMGTKIGSADDDDEE